MNTFPITPPFQGQVDIDNFLMELDNVVIFCNLRYERNQITAQEYYDCWYDVAVNLGVIQNPDTGGGGDVDNDLVLSTIQAVLIHLNNFSENTYQHFQDLETLIENISVDVVAPNLDAVINDIWLSHELILLSMKQLFDEQQAEILGLYQAILSNSDILRQDISNQTDNIVSSLANIEQQSTDIINDRISQSTATILDEVSNLNLVGNGGGVGDVSIDLSQLIPYFVDLLNVIDNFRMAFNNKDMTPEIINEIIVNAGVASEPDFDEQGNIIVGSTTIGQILQQLGIFAGDSLGFIGDDMQRALDILLSAGRNEYSDIQEFFNELQNSGFTSALLNLAWNVIAGFTLLAGMGWSASQPYRNNLETLTRTDALDGLVPLSVLIDVFKRGIVPLDEIFPRFRKLGMGDEEIGIMMQSASIQLQENYVVNAFLRGIFDSETFNQKLRQLGYREEDFSLIQELVQNLPPVQDAIVFAVREAYNEDLAEQLQLDSDYDTIKDRFEYILQGNGIDKEYAKYYWRSHWQLPSPTQFYEMLHRGLITIDELDTALKVSDYSPQWRDKLRDIAYAEFTRVDVRRMHKIGILDRTQVIEAYKRIGYPQERAEALTDFTEQYNKKFEDSELIGLSVSNILRSLNNGLITEIDARNSLIAIGQTNSDIDLLLQNSEIAHKSDILGDVTSDNRRRIINDLSKAFIEGVLSESYVREHLAIIGYPQNNIEDEIRFLNIERDIQRRTELNDIVLNQYIKYEITDSQAIDQLSNMGYNSEELNTIIDLWRNVREDRKALPTKAEAKGMLDNELINTQEYENILRGRGVVEKYIPFYKLL